jgi:hypothetical protein
MVIASSGELILVSILFFAVLSKYSVDLVITLAVQVQGLPSSYENLGFMTYSGSNELVVMFQSCTRLDCLVAYVVIVRLLSFLARTLCFMAMIMVTTKTNPLRSAVSNQNFVTIFVCSAVMLPLSLSKRSSAPGEIFTLKITVVLMIAAMYALFAVLDNSQQASEGRFVERLFRL